MKKKTVAKGLAIICIIFAILGVILIGNGFNKITSYSNPDSEYSFDTEYIKCFKILE